MNNLKGKVAIITGASSGIGLAIGKAFARVGASVVLAARREALLAAAVAEIESGGGRALAVAADVTREDDVQRLFERTAYHFGPVDILVNNAGVFTGAPTDELSAETWRQVVEINLTGAFLCSREALRVMKGRRQGRIINMGSISAKAPRPHSIAYTSTKFALEGMTRSLALDGRPFGITASIVHPGNTETQIWDGKEELAHAEGVMKPDDLAQVFVTVATMPEGVNLLESVILPITMPFLGRG